MEFSCRVRASGGVQSSLMAAEPVRVSLSAMPHSGIGPSLTGITAHAVCSVQPLEEGRHGLEQRESCRAQGRHGHDDDRSDTADEDGILGGCRATLGSQKHNCTLIKTPASCLALKQKSSARQSICHPFGRQQTKQFRSGGGPRRAPPPGFGRALSS